jgi:H+/Cl- antiporter ClcA
VPPVPRGNDSAPSAEEVRATLRSRGYVVLLVMAAVVGLGVSLASWGFLELVHQIQVGTFTDLPRDLGYHDGAPMWFYLPVLAIAGVVAAFAIARLPGNGGHVPAEGLKTGTTEPAWLPGILLAAFASIGLGLVVGPEAPLIALGGGLGLFAIRSARGDAPQQVQTVIAATGSFAAMSMIFDSPLIAAVILIEAVGLGGPTLPLILLPGLLGSAIGSLISIGMGSWTGLSTSAYALGPLALPSFARPDASDFGWTLLVAPAIAVVGFVVMRSARELHPLLDRRPFLLLPAGGLAVAGLAILFHETSGKGVDQVLFSGQDQLAPLVTQAGAWSLSALALLIAFKSLAWTVSLAGFRGGPTFPALFLGAAAGLMASHLPGFSLTAAVGVGMSAGVVTVLRLPLSAVVLGVLLTSRAGMGASPLIVLGVVAAYLTSLALDRPAEAPYRREPSTAAAMTTDRATSAPSAPTQLTPVD